MIAVVKFLKYPKKYYFKIANGINLIPGGIYEIEADNTTKYGTYVSIEGFCKDTDFTKEKLGMFRTITKAKCIDAPPIQTFHKKIIVNKDKETVCVIWKDGSKTIMKPQNGDIFDVEKGIALCFMKRMHENRGAYYKVFKDVEYFGREK